LELEKDDPDLRKNKCLDDFKKQSKTLIEKHGTDDIFKLLKYLYTLSEWVLEGVDHDDKKQIIKELLNDFDDKLLDNLINLIYDKKLYNKKTYFKRARYAFKKMCCNFRC